LKILFAGGGTAGHINPAVAMAKYIKERHPQAEIAFCGTKEGMENTLVPREGFPMYYIDVHGFKRKISLYNIGAARRAVTSLIQAKKVIKAFSPDVVVGTGGYVSGPVLYMAAKMGVPSVIHEQNASPGFTSKLLSGMVDKVMISFEESRSHFKNQEKLILTGNPVREEILYRKKDEARDKLGIGNRPLVLSFAGSLGAKAINLAMIDVIDKLKDDKRLMFVHATGERGYLWMPDKLKEHGIDINNLDNIRVEKYIYDMPNWLAAADLVICRAGAITLTELAIQGKASILIPSPNVTGNHQYYNALVFAKQGAAVLLEEKDADGESIAENIYNMLFDSSKLINMGIAAGNLAVYDSNQKIYDIIMSMLSEKK
jgi:UDP-N-acetylglucosamine--N-acetylmuramyl-(pentapeptide) pyrophosphoryl-undecaprenol N-acetylglucosamine transferase